MTKIVDRSREVSFSRTISYLVQEEPGTFVGYVKSFRKVYSRDFVIFAKKSGSKKPMGKGKMTFSKDRNTFKRKLFFAYRALVKFLRREPIRFLVAMGACGNI